jgi:methionyl-tRNA formyltransferase
VTRRAQPAGGTYFGGRGEGDEWLDWSDTSRNLYNKVRGISRPGPGARTMVCDRPVIIWRAEYEPTWPKYLATPGQVVGRAESGGVVVKTGDSTLVLREVQSDAATIGAPSWAIGTRLGLDVTARLGALAARVAELEGQLSGRRNS